LAVGEEADRVSEGYQAATVVSGRAADADSVLASDADRDAAAGQLSSALAEGRLTAGEHSERVGAAYAARSLGELGALTADLPAPARTAASREADMVADQMDRCLLCALLILCPPAGIAWLLAARRRARSRRTAGHQAAAGAVTAAAVSHTAGGAGPASPEPGRLRLEGADAADR
jgi:DUF1707 SHOCT-like domain